MMDWEKLRASIDACRPGSDDLNAPDMQDVAQQVAADESLRSLYEETQRQDARLAQAFRDVDVPSGLCDRLLAAVAAQRNSATNDTHPVETNPDEAHADKVQTAATVAAPANRRIVRRWMIGLAIAGSLMLAIFAVWRGSAPFDAAQLAELAREWTARVEANELSWQQFESDQFPQLAWRPQQWAELNTTLDPQTNVFDFSYRDGRRLLLFQVSREVRTTLPPVPYQSLPSTGPWQIGAWQENGVLYIAVSNHGPLLEALRTRYPAT